MSPPKEDEPPELGGTLGELDGGLADGRELGTGALGRTDGGALGRTEGGELGRTLPPPEEPPP